MPTPLLQNATPYENIFMESYVTYLIYVFLDVFVTLIHFYIMKKS